MYLITGISAGEKGISVQIKDQDVGNSKLTIKSKEEIMSSIIKDMCNPIDFLCQCLRIQDSERDSLDRDLTDRLSGYYSPFKQADTLTELGKGH